MYGHILGLQTEVVTGSEDGLAHTSSVRCDFLMLMFKNKLTAFVGTLSDANKVALRRALARALQLGQ